VIGESLFERELRFRWLANLEVVSFGVGYGIVGILTAWLGWGAWSLVAANLGESVLKTSVLLVARRPPRRLYVEGTAFRELIHFGGGFTAGRYFNYIALQGDNLVVGRWLGPMALGLYGRAYQLMANPAALFGDILDKVLFPTMARAQDDCEQLTVTYRRGVTLIALVMLPVSAMLYVLAPEMIELALGPKWMAVVPPFRVFAIGMLFRTSYKMSDAIARATGNVYRRAVRQVAYAGLVVGGAIVGQRWGIEGVSVAVLFALLANFLIMAQLSLKVTHLTWLQFLGAHVPPLLLSVLLVAVLWPVATLLRGVGLSAFLIVGGAGVLTAAVGFGAMWRFPDLFLGPDGAWMLSILRSYWPAKRTLTREAADVRLVG
jgi:PST family polysaccharide transporter